jgi:tRNA/tmRNA/rRNA uracil-C5-methylase (TrmA/RlmC/RlmD family)
VWQRLTGPAALRENLGGTSVFYPPNAFGQANLDLFETIVARSHGWVPAGQRVLEYHAGVGAIGLGLVLRSESVAFVEVAAGGISGLELGIEALTSELVQRVAVYQGTAQEHRQLLAGVDTAIVDPPRKGLEPALLQALCQNLPQRLIYLSCGFESFERDANSLIESGQFLLRVVEPYALFPYTDHVETLALFERRER